ncbi:GyrI-like domain-containing protein [Fulvivirga sp. 29W222]|uniref:GyrI-like domain-containing protein n=1 Tax=Fulvivirga marina TaxID=2494733 RepID=A0A937KAK3_9BACT|nr:GyrI-like domain-containing protein [Fulvivirga marina]MBL6445606.1 GyrI-like domain-containing protein [Fulvivirga marina]
MQTPRIETTPEKKLVGKSLEMTLVENKTHELWKSFMPYRSKIKHRISTDLISIQVYDKAAGFNGFDPHAKFTKWAAAEVSNFDHLPEGLGQYTLQGGLYAVFIHKGTPADFPKTFQFIFGTWLPQSPYELDNREHFELLGDKYKNNDPSSEEEVWVPVRRV